ncbi:MAG TPA: hypothetical protein VGC30_12410 [Dokdonella sp.]
MFISRPPLRERNQCSARHRAGARRPGGFFGRADARAPDSRVRTAPRAGTEYVDGRRVRAAWPRTQRNRAAVPPSERAERSDRALDAGVVDVEMRDDLTQKGILTEKTILNMSYAIE